MKHYDLLIIGAGTAGLSAAEEASKHTDNVAIVENGPKGTLCARTGCMPSKALIEAAKAYHERHKFKEFGIEHADKLTVDISATMQHVRNLRDHFVSHVKDDLKKYEMIEGTAAFVEPNIIEVSGEHYKADAVIICTGSSPRVPDVFSSLRNEVLTTDNLFDQTSLPERFTVVGMGGSGVEMAQALARLGKEVTTIEQSMNIAGITDPEINKTAQQLLQKEIDIRIGTDIHKVEKVGTSFKLETGNDPVIADGILVSAGRIPNLDGLGLKEIDIALDENGIPEFNQQTLKIKDQPIYIAGDANADRAIQHEASDEGKIAAQHALGKHNIQERRTPLTITFTAPPIVQVGKSYASLDTNSTIIGEVSYRHQGRATLEQENHGKARLYASENGKILGTEMIAPAADHFGHLLALAIQEEIPIKSLLEAPTYHPVLEEGLRTALGKMEKKRKQAA